MKSNLALKRVVAYLIDFLIITLISSALVYLTFLNPKYDEYMKASDEYSALMNDYYDKKINTTELTEKAQDISYDLTKTGYVYVIGDIVIAFLYFGVFAYYTKGQTLGKKIMKIRIVSKKEGKDVKLYQYFIRTFILNGIILNIISLIAICFTKKTFMTIYAYGSNFDTILMIVNFLMVMFQVEGRGIHDILAGTKVIDLKSVNIEVKEESEVEVAPKKKTPKKEEVKDAKIVESKKKTTKKKTTSKTQKKDAK